jgi:hypothetical protein
MRARLRSLWRRAPVRARIALLLAAPVLAAAVAVPLAVFPAGGGSGLCSGSASDDFSCYEAHLESLVDGPGAEAALAELARLSRANGYVLANCHTLAHAVGHEALAVYKTVDEASKHGDYTCWSGYFHGVYEVYMSKFDDRELLRVVPTLCTRPPDNPYAFDYYNCIHGLGHGVTIRFGNDPFEALPYCDTFPDSWQRANCYTGVFMQNIVVDRQMHESVRLDPDDPVYPCNAVEHRYKGACYLTQTSYILRVLEYDYAEGFAVCDGVEAEFVATCYVSMGRDISGNSHREAKLVVERCSLGDPSHQADCYVGAARNAVFHDHGTQNADALCGLVPAAYRDRCEEARDNAAGTL